MNRVCATVISLVILNAASFSAEPGLVPPFWRDLGQGPYAVGFRVIYYRDQARKWVPGAVHDPGRPIRVSVWYPATPVASARPMTYGDYLHHEGPDGFRHVDETLDRMDRESWLADLRELVPSVDSTFARLLATPVAAYRDASPAPGHFPLVLYSGGKASRADANVELGEYLASYGYIVATVPQLGLSREAIELGSSPEEISLHASDFDAALVPLHGISQIDFHRIATAGHSAGGEVAVELALRHPDVVAVIGLDGSYGMTGGAPVLMRLPEYAPGRPMAAALLDLRRSGGSQGAKLDLTAIDRLRWTHVYRFEFAKAFHGDFTEWGMIAFKMGIPMPRNPDGHTRQIGHEVNQRTCHAVLDFLDAQLRGSPDALGRLNAAGHDPEKFSVRQR